MKTKHLIFSITAAILLLTGCESTDSPTLSVDSLSPARIDAPAQGITQSITVKAVGEWTAAVTDGQDGSWITITGVPGSGEGTFTVTAGASDNIASRTTTIDVKAGDSIKQIPVTQEAAAQSLTLDEESKTVDHAAQTLSVGVVTEGEWVAEIVGDISWFTVNNGTSTGNGQFSLEIQSNESPDQRVGTVKVFLKDAEEVSEDFVLTQNGQPVEETPTNFLVSPLDNYEDELDVNVAGSWTVTCDADWIQILTPSGNGPGKLRIRTSANSDIAGKRTAEIKVTSAAGGMTVAASQPPFAVRLQTKFVSQSFDLYWCTLSVNEPGTFTAKPGDRGRYYQFNRKVGYTTSFPIIPAFPEEGDRQGESSHWLTENDPCPEGWRIPARNEGKSVKPAVGGTPKITVIQPDAGFAEFGGIFTSIGDSHVPESSTLYDYPENCLFMPSVKSIYNWPGSGISFSGGGGGWGDIMSRFWTNEQRNNGEAGYEVWFGKHDTAGDQVAEAMSKKNVATQVRCVKEPGN